MKGIGPSLSEISPGRHELKLTSENFRFSEAVLTNDFSFEPQGRINTLYIEGGA